MAGVRESQTSAVVFPAMFTTIRRVHPRVNRVDNPTCLADNTPVARRWTKGYFCAAFALCATLTVGCGTDDAPSTPPVRTATTLRGGYVVTYVPHPDPIPFNDLFTIDISVRKKDDSALPTDLAVKVNGEMEQHGHGMNVRPVVTRKGEGEYLGEGLMFHMPGTWRLLISVSANDVTEVAVFPVVMEP